MTQPTLSWYPSAAVRQVYQGRIRDGKFGSLTSETFQVWEASDHRLGFLNPFPEVDYRDDSYRTSVNDSASVEQYFSLHREQQPGYLNLFRDLLKSGATVADCGCGGGALLDLVKQVTGGATLAIEPFGGFHTSLRSRGHQVCGTAEQACDEGHDSMDLALSFHVIEHVDDPLNHLRLLRQLVRPGGHAVVLTPNWDDFLLTADPDRMAPFFYRRVHNYYFTAQALGWVAELAGWRVTRGIHYQEFGLANALLWLRDGRPRGHSEMSGVDDSADAFWKSYLERSGRSNHVGVVLERT